MSSALPSVAPTTPPLPPVRVVNWGNLVFCAVSLFLSFVLSVSMVRHNADEQAARAVLPTHIAMRRVALPWPLSNATVLTAGEYGVVDVARRLVMMFAAPLLHQLHFGNLSRLDKVLTLSELYRQIWLVPRPRPGLMDDGAGDGELTMLHLCDAHACVMPVLLSTLMRTRPRRTGDEAVSQATQTFVRTYVVLFGEANASAVVRDELAEHGVVTATSSAATTERWHTQPLYGTWPQGVTSTAALSEGHAAATNRDAAVFSVQGRCDRCGICTYRATGAVTASEAAHSAPHGVATTQYVQMAKQHNASQRSVRCEVDEYKGGVTWYETPVLQLQDLRFGDSRTFASLPDVALVHVDVGARHAVAVLAFLSGLASFAAAAKDMSAAPGNVLVALYLTAWWLPTVEAIRRLQACCGYRVLLLQGSQCAVYVRDVAADVTANELTAIAEGYTGRDARDDARYGEPGGHAMQPTCTLLLSRQHSSVAALLHNVTAVTADESTMLRFFASTNTSTDAEQRWPRWSRGRRWWAMLLLVPLTICTLLLRGLAQRCKH